MERINATTGSYNFIDLFAGAGGLSEGFIQAGFSPVAHVEMNPYAAQTLETRTGYYYLKAQGKLDIYKDYISGKITRDEFLQHIPEEQLQSVFCETMSNETLPRLFENIDRILTQRGIKQVDVIIGGPPCQAYSLVGRAQSKHMETPMSADPRNDLYKLYARFLQKYHPKMFVFENVMGIKSANSGATWLKVQEALRSVGYEIECHEQNSKNFGVLQNRRRMIIVGWLKNTGLSYPQFEQTIADATVNDILSDLPALQPGGKSGEYRSDDFSDYLRSTGIRKDSDILTHHCARPNKDRDIEIYRRSIVIASYDYSSKLIKRFPHVKWDFLIIDEAHNLRNVFHGTKRAKNLYDLTHGIPKILLTATPLQNSLTDLHGLVSFIDPRIFGSEKVFNRRFVDGCDYEELKQELLPVLYRTLRRDVGKYMAFSKRTCITVDFHLSTEEKELYDVTNDFLRRDPLYSIPNANRGLIILVIRKLLASSSFALIETFEVLEKRLEKLYEGTKSAYAQEGFDLFWGFVEDEIDEDGFNEYDDEETAEKKQAIQAELKIVRHILEMARAIKTNAKIIALREALKSAFAHQISEGLNQKAVVFTESKRTQKYIAAELRKSGYSEEDILLFNGDFDDAMTKEIFRTWQVKNFGKTNYGRSVEYKHAIVDYFKSHAKILIVTDAGSEGLNLQFCNTIINYDLPWNPQKIEQRIGRCHRYGQTHDVVAINLLNTDNEADRRVYDILSKKFELFEGVFGASDVALGALESGVSFEKRILDIYQNCKNITAVRKAFAALNRQLDARKNAHVAELRSILLTESREAKGQALEKTKADIDKYLRDVEYWNQFEEPEVNHKLHYWKIDNWGEKIFGSHGVLFLGAFMDNTKLLFPVLLLCDENGEYINFTEDEIVSALEEANDSDVRYFKPTDEEQSYFHRIYARLISEVQDQHDKTVAPTIAYNKKKMS